MEAYDSSDDDLYELQEGVKECTKCDRIFESVGGFYYHMANRVCDRYCLECSKQNKARKKIRSFTREQMLSYHMHCKESICECCGRSFNVKQMLESHVKKRVCKKILAPASFKNRWNRVCVWRDGENGWTSFDE